MKSNTALNNVEILRIFAGDGDKENSAFTVPTDTRMTRTAPSQLLKHTNMNKTPSIKTPSIPETVSAEVPQKSRIAAAAVAAAAAATAAAAAVRPRTPATSAEPPSTSFAVTDAAAPIATSERKQPYWNHFSTILFRPSKTIGKYEWKPIKPFLE